MTTTTTTTTTTLKLKPKTIFAFVAIFILLTYVGCDDAEPVTIESSVIIQRSGDGIGSATIIFPHTENGGNHPDKMVVSNAEEIETLITQLRHIIRQLEGAKEELKPNTELYEQVKPTESKKSKTTLYDSK